jgi:hypothetical protein
MPAANEKNAMFAGLCWKLAGMIKLASVNRIACDKITKKKPEEKHRFLKTESMSVWLSLPKLENELEALD